MLIICTSGDSQTGLDYTRPFAVVLDELGAKMGTLPVLPRPPPGDLAPEMAARLHKEGNRALLISVASTPKTGSRWSPCHPARRENPAGPVRRWPAGWPPWPGAASRGQRDLRQEKREAVLSMYRPSVGGGVGAQGPLPRRAGNPMGDEQADASSGRNWRRGWSRHGGTS